jgi:hypothetical protein
MGSDGHATVTVGGKTTAAEQQPADLFGHCVVRTASGNVTTVDSGRLRAVKDQASF